MLLDELGDYLSTNGVGTEGTDLFFGYLPEAQGARVMTALYETGGLGAAHGMAASPGQAKAERPRLQVVVRSTSYQAARLKAQDAWRLLDGLGDVTLNGVRYLGVYAVQSPFLMGRDEQNRPLVACNYDVTKSLSTA